MRTAKVNKIPEYSDWAVWFAPELARFNALSTQLQTYVRLVDEDDEDFGRFDDIAKKMASLVRSMRRLWYSKELADIDYEFLNPTDPFDIDELPLSKQAEVLKRLKWAEGVRAKLAALHNEASVIAMVVDRMTARYRTRGVTSVDYFKAETKPILQELADLRQRQREIHEMQYPRERSEESLPVFGLDD